MSRRIQIACLSLVAASLCACISQTSRQYGMDYDITHSRAWNVLNFFGYAPLPEDRPAPKEFLSGANSHSFAAAQVITSSTAKSVPTPAANDAQSTFTMTGLVDAMQKSFTKSTDENQFFGFCDDTEIRRNFQAQKKVVSTLARAFFNQLRKSSSENKFYLDLVRTEVKGDTLFTSMAVFLENESLGCKYVLDANRKERIGTCGIVFITKSEVEAKPSLIPFVIGGLKVKAEQSRPQEFIADFLERDDRFGFRYGSDPYAQDKALTGMPAFKWDGKTWQKTTEFDAILEPAFRELTKSLPPLTFVYHKAMEVAPGKVAAPYLIEGNGFDFFFIPGKDNVPVGQLDDK